MAKLAFDACIVLLRSEAFDAIVCALPPEVTGVFASNRLGSYLASLSAKSGTSLVLMSTRHHRRPTEVLGSSADYRVQVASRRALWAHGQLSGSRLVTRTERARAGEASEGEQHELTFSLESAFPSGAKEAIGGAVFQLRASARLTLPASGAVRGSTALTPALRDRPSA